MNNWGYLVCLKCLMLTDTGIYWGNWGSEECNSLLKLKVMRSNLGVTRHWPAEPPVPIWGIWANRRVRWQ